MRTGQPDGLDGGSMTDITEPNRVREQLSASFERFTTVLEALDAAVSVAPLGSEEMLFANRLYRLWFGAQTPTATWGWWPRPACLESQALHDEVPGRRGLLRRPAHRPR
jgi:PAS domain-containing protein